MSSQTKMAPAVDELLLLLQETGKTQAEKDLSGILGYVSLLEKQMNSVHAELQNVRQELAKMQEPGPVMAAWLKLAEKLQAQMAALRQQLAAVKNAIAQGAQNAIVTVKQGGIETLDGTLRFLHARDGLNAISAGLDGAAKDAAATRRKVAAITAEYHETGRHLKNFGRAIRGKEPLEQPKPEGKLSQGTQSFFTGVQNVLAGAALDADKAAGLLARLEQTASKGKEERASLKENLRAKKSSLPPPQKAEPGKERQEVL